MTDPWKRMLILEVPHVLPSPWCSLCPDDKIMMRAVWIDIILSLQLERRFITARWFRWDHSLRAFEFSPFFQSTPLNIKVNKCPVTLQVEALTGWWFISSKVVSRGWWLRANQGTGFNSNLCRVLIRPSYPPSCHHIASFSVDALAYHIWARWFRVLWKSRRNW